MTIDVVHELAKLLVAHRSYDDHMGSSSLRRKDGAFPIPNIFCHRRTRTALKAHSNLTLLRNLYFDTKIINKNTGYTTGGR
ncbi:hypothetical protein GDO81_006993 [Engystomops pustulosus]|uniref:Uncharacterized protein n=1 Tax=Engystomops pustulosus TaxID=76066 RepID=A0AAV7D0N0_ENGPU|nr:hypothetical protein GDO81_006993 [Engystomops pustulosus]